MSQILEKRYAQKERIPNKKKPTRLAVIQESNLFRLSSFGVQIARKRVTIQITERTKIIIPKLPLMSFLSTVAISLGLIPKILTKKDA